MPVFSILAFTFILSPVFLPSLLWGPLSVLGSPSPQVLSPFPDTFPSCLVAPASIPPTVSISSQPCSHFHRNTSLERGTLSRPQRSCLSGVASLPKSELQGVIGEKASRLNCLWTGGRRRQTPDPETLQERTAISHQGEKRKRNWSYSRWSNKAHTAQTSLNLIRDRD